jgi:cell division septation protein DedD
MRSPLRLGATVALGALLLVGLLASPALAWEWGVSAEAVCEEGGTTARVDFTVESKEKGAEGDVAVVAVVDGEPFGKPVTGKFGPESDTVTGSFTGVPLDAESVKVKAFVQWKGQKEPEKRHTDVELPKDCKPTPTTAPPTTAPPTTAPPTTVAPTTVPPTTEAPTTTEGEEVLPATSTTTSGPQLPFTGANSGPLLLAAIALVGGGFAILWASRLRGRHEAR